MTQLTFNKKYFFYAFLLFIVEFLIEKYIHDDFIRPYVGDFLIVILMYCFLKSFFNTSVKTTAILVLIISYAIETLQYLNILDLLGWRQSYLANIVMGNYFSWVDILAYSLGILVTVATEQITLLKHNRNQLFI